MTQELMIVQESANILELPLPVATDIVVVAKTADEMVSSREKLAQWAAAKVLVAKEELVLAETELAKVKEMKQRTASYRTKVAEAKDTVVFYEKIQAALAAGYCIVPEFPIQIIAVRTCAEEPPAVERKADWRGLPAFESESPPLGEGQYVSPITKNTTESRTEGEDEKAKIVKYRVATGFRKVSFPVKFARMEILENLDKAQTHRIFDAIGLLPSTARPRPDPMLIGRVEHGSSGKVVSFMIAWWIDTKTL
jgi:hypothetical protein